MLRGGLRKGASLRQVGGDSLVPGETGGRASPMQSLTRGLYVEDGQSVYGVYECMVAVERLLYVFPVIGCASAQLLVVFVSEDDCWRCASLSATLRIPRGGEVKGTCKDSTL